MLKSIKKDEANYKLLKIMRKEIGPNKIPYIVTDDGRTIRFPHPDISVNDTIKYDIIKKEIISWTKFETGNIAYCIHGNNIGRIGTLIKRDVHDGAFDIVFIKDKKGKTFATRSSNIMMIGEKKPLISMPKEEGIYLSPVEKLKA